jgi:ATP-binding cassette subfamily C protein
VWIGLFGAAAVRAIPSFNRIFVAFLEIKTNAFVVEELQKFAFKPDLHGEVDIKFDREIRLHQIRYGYTAENPLFENLSLTIKKGEKVALTGKSGSGKSTLLMLIMQFLNQDSGDVLVDHAKLNGKNLDAWRRHIAYVPQHAIMLDASIIDNITFGKVPQEKDVAQINTLIHYLGLGPWLSALPEGLMTRLGERGIKISGGQRQRLAIARALFSGRPVLLLDEITSQLDDETERVVWEALKKAGTEGMTIIMITHRRELFSEFDSVYELTGGEFVRQAPPHQY